MNALLRQPRGSQTSARSVDPGSAQPLPDLAVRRSASAGEGVPQRPARRRGVRLALGVMLLALAAVGAAAWARPEAFIGLLDRSGLSESRLGAQAKHLLRGPSAAPPAVPLSRLPVVGLGRIEPQGEVIRVAAPSGVGDARVERLLIGAGDRVEAGARLAILDNEQRLAASLAVARAEVAQRSAALDRTRLVVETERAQRAAAVSRARAEVETARTEFERTRSLFARGVSTAASLDQRELGFRQGAERLAEAEAAALRYAGPIESQADLVLARRELDAAAASVARAEADLVQGSVTAPVAGRILQIHVRPGERIGSSSLLDMGATEVMMVRAEIYESDVGRLSPGLAATVTATPLGQPLAGAVERIGLQVQRQAIVDATPAANTDARVVEAWIRLDPASSERAAGLTGLQVRVRAEP